MEIKEIDKNCSYCGMEYPYPKQTLREGEFYLIFKDMERDASPEDAPEYITICPMCISTMVSTYKIGHKYEFVGVLENSGASSNVSEGVQQSQRLYRECYEKPYHVLPCQRE